jgi:hypothetical protein
MNESPGSTRLFACDFCGYESRHDASQPVEAVQCPQCGEPVTPLT